MKIAVIGTRTLSVDISPYIPVYCTAIVSGGAAGIDRCAARYAKDNGLELIEFLPEYELYGKLAPLQRNNRIIDCADSVIAFWDGYSRGTRYVIDRCNMLDKPLKIVMMAKK